ncbi:MAG: 4-hydroxy-3-methylbut-2-enyl diphosphate reductase [Chloroflexi bacterium]|nr:4-hydroxy-3-methylbut-2-enyl diphosphate reductase [Chloroflexota bacterium]
MALRVEKAAGIGFCFGVKRCIEILEKAAQERGRIESLGAPVHNQQVLERLARRGIHIAGNIDEIKGDAAAISAHGISPVIEAELRQKFNNVINTTCPFVHRAQLAARRLARAGFFVIVYGEAEHPEVKGILGWADNRGIATLDTGLVRETRLPRRLGILSQTTQILPQFTEFASKMIDLALIKDGEIRVIDTICHDIRRRQKSTIDLARKADVMVVVGSRTSANTRHLVEFCGAVKKTYLTQTADEIQPDWFKGCRHVGVTSGASTPDETIDEVVARLEEIE